MDALDNIEMFSSSDGKGVVIKVIEDSNNWAEVVLSFENTEIFADCLMNLAARLKEKAAERAQVS